MPSEVPTVGPASELGRALDSRKSSMMHNTLAFASEGPRLESYHFIAVRRRGNYSTFLSLLYKVGRRTDPLGMDIAKTR